MPHSRQHQSELQNLRTTFHEKNNAYKQEEEKGREEQSAILNLQKELEQAKSRLLELVRLISHHRNEAVRLTSLSVRYEEATKSKERELEKIRLRRLAFDEQILSQDKLVVEMQEKLITIENTLTAIDDLQRQDQAASIELERTIQNARERLARLEAEKISLERWLSQDPVALAASALRHASLPGVYGPVSDLLKTSGPYQRLLDRALGDRADYFVADTLNDAQAAIRYLSEERKGWAVFLILDRLSGSHTLPALDEHFGSRSLAVQVNSDDRIQIVKQFLIGSTYYVGATLFEESLIMGGAEPEMESFQATPSDLGGLVQELSGLRQTLESSFAERARLEHVVTERTAERAPISEDQRKVQVLSQVQQESLQRLRDEVQMNETEEKLLTRERDESVQLINKTQESLKQEEILLATLEEEEKSLQSSFQNQDTALQNQRHTVQTHLAHISQLRLEAETLRERLLGKEREAENAQSRLDAFGDRSQQISTEQSETDSRLTQLAQIQVEKSQLLESLQSAKEQQNGALTELLTQRQELQAQLHTHEEELAACRDTLSTAQTQAQRSGICRADTGSRKDSLGTIPARPLSSSPWKRRAPLTRKSSRMPKSSRA